MISLHKVEIDGKIREAKIDTLYQVGNLYWAELDDGTFFLTDFKLNVYSKPINKKLVCSFTSDDKKDICIGVKGKEDSLPFYYHYQEQEDGTYYCVFSTDVKGLPYFSFQESPVSDLWLLQDANLRQAVYDYKKHEQITPFFDDLDFDIEDTSIHMAQYYRNILVKDVDDSFFTSSALIGYIDHNGYFSSRIYDISKKKYYFVNSVGNDSIRDFENIYNEITRQYQFNYENELVDADKVLDEMLNERVEREIITPPTKPASIIYFKDINKR